jgi:hypothetical protein
VIAEVAAALANPALRVVLFTGAEGGERAGDFAFAAARLAAQGAPRFVIMDIGLEPSEALGGRERPGLGDLLAGEAAFGECDPARRRFAGPHDSDGRGREQPPLQRLQIVIGALAHTYDKVMVVADTMADWPEEHIRPDLAVIVCGPHFAEESRGAAREAALARGARDVLVVRYGGHGPGELGEVSVAA